MPSRNVTPRIPELARQAPQDLADQLGLLDEEIDRAPHWSGKPRVRDDGSPPRGSDGGDSEDDAVFGRNDGVEAGGRSGFMAGNERKVIRPAV